MQVSLRNAAAQKSFSSSSSFHVDYSPAFVNPINIATSSSSVYHHCSPRRTTNTPTPARRHGTCSASSISSCLSSPPPHPDDPNNRGNKHRDTYKFKRTIRVPRRQTYHDSDWQWTGGSKSTMNSSNSSSNSNGLNIPDINTFQQSLDKVMQVLDKSRQTLSQTTVPFLITSITAIGARMLRRVSHVLGRAFLVDDDHIDLTVEYGIADPCPSDKTFVDPLKDWDIVSCKSCSDSSSASNPNGYYDSFGNIVYLQLHGITSGTVAAADYRDSFDETDNERDGSDEHPNNKSPSSSSNPGEV